MDSSTKERLVGAAILITLVVLVVPAVLTGPHEHQAPDDQPVPGSRVVQFDMVGPNASQPVEETGEQPLAGTGTPEQTPVAAEAGSTAGPAPAPAAASSAALEAADEGHTVGPESAPEQRQSIPATPPAAGWAVQVAALSSDAAAAQLAQKLKARGYAAFVLEYRAGGKILYRVRVGPEASREAAATLERRLQAEGLKTAVVTHP